MSPCSPLNNLVDVALADAVFAGKVHRLLAVPVPSSDITDSVVGQLCKIDSCPACRSTLPHHIRRVIQRRAEEQMIRIAAWRIVTGVKNLQTIRNRAIRQLPSNTVSRLMLPVEIDHTISVVVTGSWPSPASVWILRHTAPKSVFDTWTSSRRSSARLRTVTGFTDFDLVGNRQEGRTTVQAETRDARLFRHLPVLSVSAMPGAVSSSAPVSLSPFYHLTLVESD